jgi:hypothetical protein
MGRLGRGNWYGRTTKGATQCAIIQVLIVFRGLFYMEYFMPRALRVLLSLVAVVVLTSTARAQNCLGAPSFAVGMARLSGYISIADSLKTYGGDLALGREKGFFIEGGGSHSKLNDRDNSSNQGGGRIGYQMSMDQWHFCPYAGVNVQSGSATGDHPSGPLNTTDVFGGGSLGWVLTSSGDMQIIPAIGAAVVRRSMTAKLVPSGSTAATSTDNFGVVTAAVGFVFHKTWTITPNVQIPASEINSSVTYGISLSVNFNGLKR